MGYNIENLIATTGINPIMVWIKAGLFSHRHPRDKADPEQCKVRQQYLDKVPDGEWLLVLDSDETLLGGLEMIAPVLEMANISEANGDRVDVISISEFLPDLTILNRPRFIKKREGLKYGGPDMKHDYITYCEDRLHGDQPPCEGCINYINPKATNQYMWTMEGIFFWHNKNGPIKMYHTDGADMKAFNLVSVKHKQGPMVVTTTAQEAFKKFKTKEQEDKYDMYKEIVRD